MKKMIILFLLFFSMATMAQTKKASEITEKKYSEAEVKKMVDDKVREKLNKLTSSDSVQFSKELLKKERELELKELELRKRQENFKIVGKDFDKKIKDFNLTQGKIIGCLNAQDEKKEKRVNHMVDVISGMKPDSAAQVLSVQEPALSVEILGRLDATKVSKIFNKMEKEVSARLQKMYMTMKR